jgi:hypothetical protein
VYEVRKIVNGNANYFNYPAPTCRNNSTPLIFASLHSFPTKKAYDTTNQVRNVNFIQPKVEFFWKNSKRRFYVRTLMMDEDGNWKDMQIRQVELAVIAKCP